MELKLGFVGFGNVARAFARMLEDHRSRLQSEFGLTWRTTGIATASHGCVTSTAGIDLTSAVRAADSGLSMLELPGTVDVHDSNGLITHSAADLIFETTPLNPVNGEPAIGYVRAALERGMSVVTANKGTIAFAYRELKELAVRRGVAFRFEGAVMDGAPVFNVIERCMPGVTVLGFEGVLNSTTNHILTGMEEGRSFDECLLDAQRRGIAEADPDHDIEGWDAAVKAIGLANVLMGSDLRLSEVERRGIREITRDQLDAAASAGKTIRLVARARGPVDRLKITVAPEAVPLSSALGSVKGTSNVLVLRTDLMGELAIVETDPGIEQTAYALLSDMLLIHELPLRREDTKPH